MYNELFESIIRTSGENTDYLDDRADNFWAPVPIIEQMFEQVLKEAVIEAEINEEKEAHERHFGKIGFEWYYFGSTIEDINEKLKKFESCFNKESKINGQLVKYCSYKITDDKNGEIIGWFNYLIFTSDFKTKSINCIKLKLEEPKAENDCKEQVIKHLMYLFENKIITQISWEASNDAENKRIKQYSNMCKHFGGKPDDLGDIIVFTIPYEAFVKNKEAILRYFRLK